MVISLAKTAIQEADSGADRIKFSKLPEGSKEIIGDFHIHSRFSRATSKNLTIDALVKWARIKGINLLGTGDISHEEWLAEIKSKLKDNNKGIFFYKDSEGEFPFILTGEISLVFTQAGKGRRVHLVYLVPNLEINSKINNYLSSKGRRDYDGRPIFKITCEEFVKQLKSIDSRIEIIPAHCILPDTFIHMGNFTKKIKELNVGDKVFTHTGSFKKIKEILINDYDGEIFHIKPWYFLEGLRTTPEHPIYAIKSYKKCPSTKGTCKPLCSNLKWCKDKKYTRYTPLWICAKDLEKSDFLVYPRDNNLQDIKQIDLRDYVGEFKQIETGYIISKLGRNHVGKIKIKLNCDERFCRLIGYFLSEGYLIGKDAIAFSFHSKEKEYIQEVVSTIKDYFGFEISKTDSRRENQADIILYSKILNSFFRQFYSKEVKRASTKFLPDSFLNLPKEKLAEILRGWWRGDTGTTVSRQLADKMKSLCLKIGIIPSIKVYPVEYYLKKYKKFISGRAIIPKNDTFVFSNLSFFENDFGMLKESCFKKSINKLKRKHGWIDKNYAYLPIKEIRKEKYSGEVYNLEVEEDNSYVTEFACVHNCWTPFFGVFGSESGFDSLKEAFGNQWENVHAIETGMSCYDEETEVLTNNGWKRVGGVSKEDKVCTLKNQEDKIEFQKPTKLFKYDYKGKMYSLKTKRVELLVTPNHNLFCSHCNFRKKPNFILKEAESLFGKSKRFKKNGIWIGENPPYFILPGIKISHGSRFYSGYRESKEKKFDIKNWLKFFGFWIAEGFTSKGKGGDYGTYLVNKDAVIIQEMKKILEDFGYNVYQYENRGLQTLRIRDFQLFSYLQKFGKAAQKFIPQEVKSLSRELLEIFFKYYIKGDGNIYGRNKKGLRATTISKSLRDDLQEVALKIGMSAYYRLHKKKGTPIVSLYKAAEKGYLQSEDSWNVYFIRENIHTVMPSTLKKWGYKETWQDYDGKVYCLEVPNHVIYIRRNSIPVWCGNSDPEMNWKIKELESKAILSFSDSHSFWPWRLGREATIFALKQNEEMSYNLIIDQIRNKTFISTIETDPGYGKYHYDGHRLCNFSCSPKKSKELNNICPICKKELIIGVENRIGALTDNLKIPLNAKPFYKILPLHELIAFQLKTKVENKKTWLVYNKLIAKFHDEFNILLKVERTDLIKELAEEKLEALADLIIDNRIANLKVQPGYDGVYGFLVPKEAQKTLL